MKNTNNTAFLHLPECPLCEIKRPPQTAVVLRTSGDMQLVHITCKKCHGQVVAVYIDGDLGIRSVGLVTDLDSEDVVRVLRRKALNTDDVIAAHRLVNSSDFLKSVAISSGRSFPLNMRSFGG